MLKKDVFSPPFFLLPPGDAEKNKPRARKGRNGLLSHRLVLNHDRVAPPTSFTWGSTEEKWVYGENRGRVLCKSMLSIPSQSVFNLIILVASEKPPEEHNHCNSPLPPNPNLREIPGDISGVLFHFLEEKRKSFHDPPSYSTTEGGLKGRPYIPFCCLWVMGVLFLLLSTPPPSPFLCSQ